MATPNLSGCIACAFERVFEFEFADRQHTCEKGTSTASSESRYAFSDYQDDTASTAVYPDAGNGNTSTINYGILGLIGEAGEIANKWKKFYRDAPDSDNNAVGHAEFYKNLRNDILDELGDVLWYASQLSTELGTELEDVAHRNIRKLKTRQVAGTLHGSGDSR